MNRSPDTESILTGEVSALLSTHFVPDTTILPRYTLQSPYQGAKSFKAFESQSNERLDYLIKGASLSMKKQSSNNDAYERKNIAEPNSHDVLCGR